MKTHKPLHIFKPGRQIAMSGAALDFSESDLAASAAAYDPALHEAPIVVGHPKHDDPAYGWIKSLSASGSGLEAVPHQVDAAFAEMVEKGSFKKISASFYLPGAANNPVPSVYYLRHVGFLGAQPPAVKGLRDVSFGDTEEGVVEFADWGLETNASLWRSMREWLLAKFGQEVADKVIPDWQIESIREAARQEDASLAAFGDHELNAQAGASSAESNSYEESHEVTPERAAELEAENNQLKQRLEAADTEKRTAAATKRREDHASFAEQLIADGKLLPKHKDAVIAFLDFADGETSVEFGEGDDKQPLATAFKSFLGDMPKAVDFGEHATKGKAAGDTPAGTVNYGENVDPDRAALDGKIRQYMQDHSVDYATAAACVIK